MTTPVALAEWLDRVSDEVSFLAFVEALRLDREADAGNWENDSIESFLESAHAWATDTDFGRQQGLADASPWKKLAVFLYAGKIYE